MPSQSRWDGESSPDHWIWTESPDLVRVWGVIWMEKEEEMVGMKKRVEEDMERRKKRSMVLYGSMSIVFFPFSVLFF